MAKRKAVGVPVTEMKLTERSSGRIEAIAAAHSATWVDELMPWAFSPAPG